MVRERRRAAHGQSRPQTLTLGEHVIAPLEHSKLHEPGLKHESRHAAPAAHVSVQEELMQICWQLALAAQSSVVPLESLTVMLHTEPLEQVIEQLLRMSQVAEQEQPHPQLPQSSLGQAFAQHSPEPQIWGQLPEQLGQPMNPPTVKPLHSPLRHRSFCVHWL
jgi:hypothetical protein